MAKRLWLSVGVILLLAGAGVAWFAGTGRSNSNEPAYRTARIDRGDITASVRATGTVNPVTTVLVGSQLSGQIIEISADYNSPVREGQVIARLFSEQIKSRRDAALADLVQGRADLSQRRAQIDRTKATRQKAEATLRDQRAQRDRIAALLAEARRNADRQRELTGRGVGSTTALETAETQVQIQTASLASSDAQIAVAEAELGGLDADIRLAEAQAAAAEAVIQAREAKLRDIEIDLARTEIKSPVDGVVIQRQIELGQTVAASLNAPTLFTIAQDLRAVDVYANVDESDVGRIKPGQPVTFTVNAYPERTFRGSVKMVRLSAQTVQNVVTYTAIISVDNPDMALLPGMTANLQVVTEERQDALRVPNAALRFRPVTIAASEPAGTSASSTAPAVRRGEALVQWRERIVGAVKPTEDQLARIDEIFAQARAGLDASAAASAAGGDRRQGFMEARRRLAEQISSVLDEERRKTFRQLLAESGRGSAPSGTPGQLYTLDAQGQPRPIPVRLGVTDGVFTEVVAGALQAGDTVISGGGPRATATDVPPAPRGPRGPRLF